MFRLGKTADIFKNLPGKGGNKGMICYNALITDIKLEKGKEGIKGTDFLEYLKNNPEMGDKSYLSYVQRAGGPGRINIMLSGDDQGEGLIKINEQNGYEIAFIEKSSDEQKNSWYPTSLSIGSTAVTAIGAGLLVIGTGGTALILGSVLIAGGAIATGTGVTLQLEQYFVNRDLSSIVMIDMSNQKIREEFHKHVFIAGDLE